jgi:hypothetical protein
MNSRPLLVVLALAAAPLAAQHPGQPMGRGGMGHMMGDPMGMQEMMGPVMAVMVYAPQHLLARRDALGLTADQVARLTGLEAATTTAHDAALAEAKAHIQAIAKAAEAAPDTAALKAQVEAAHAAMGKAQWTALASALQAKRVLNDDQRVKVKAWADSMHAWMAQHRRMMNPSESH